MTEKKTPNQPAPKVITESIRHNDGAEFGDQHKVQGSYKIVDEISWPPPPPPTPIETDG